MLKSLHISNYALIERLDIDFESGFLVLTGETGAGKSIILGALGLVTGLRADSKSIKQGQEKCIVEASFDITNYKLKGLFEENDWDYEANNCLIRRELTAQGKSRAFINDTPVGLNQLRLLTDYLIDIHSQHENLLLSKTNYQREVLDIVAQNEPLLSLYRECYEFWRKLRSDLSRLMEHAEKSKADREYIQFQYSRLNDAQLKEGEQEEIEQELKTLEHAEEIKTELLRFNASTSDENAALPLLKEGMQSLSKIKHFIPEGDKLYDRTQSLYIELKDVTDEAYSLAEKVEVDPLRLESLSERLHVLYDLQKKHNVSSNAALIEIRDALATKLDEIESFDDEINKLEQKIETLTAELHDLAEAVGASRRSIAPLVKSELENTLRKLGMPNVCFEVDIRDIPEFTSQGKEEVQFLFSANKNRLPEPIAQIASGGEMSRLMLSIKALIAGKISLPTIIFDEIDTGVSGEIADRMGKIMSQMALDGMQIISITHLPQIAGRGKVHYKVFKTENEQSTHTQIRRINDEERVVELAKMLSGSHVSEAALQNAAELLKNH